MNIGNNINYNLSNLRVTLNNAGFLSEKKNIMDNKKNIHGLKLDNNKKFVYDSLKMFIWFLNYIVKLLFKFVFIMYFF